MKQNLDEGRLNEAVEMKAERYMKKYGKYINSLSKSPVAKVRSIGMFDAYALGKQLEAFEDLRDFAEADGSVSDLGILPQIALDVITVAYGSSPVTIVSTVQPIDEEQGIIYYKNVVAGNTAGDLTSGQNIITAQGGQQVVPSQYASDKVTEAHGNTASGTTQYSFYLSLVPVRTQGVTIQVALSGGTITATDDGLGHLFGVGFNGDSTINYTTGQVYIDLTVNPGGAYAMTAIYQQSLEEEAQIRSINYQLTSAPVKADVYSLRGTLGMLKSYALQKRFGKVAEDELANDLVQGINTEIFGDILAKMLAAEVGNTNWDSTPPNTVSYFEHKQTYKDYLAKAEAVIVGNAGRGTVSYHIAGLSVCAILQTLPGFVKLYDGNSIGGAHLFGTLDGVPVIRVPLAAQLNPMVELLGYKGTSVFETACVYAPYMPLTTTAMLPTANPLVGQKAAAIWAATQVVIANFLTTLTVTT